MIGSFGFILFHAASGAFIGYGISAGKLIKYLSIAIILQLPFNTINDLGRLFFSNSYFPYLQFSLVVYGATFFIYVIKKIMPQILTRKIRRKRG
jgi:hypothetical protein